MLAIATVLLRDALFGDKCRRVMAPGLQLFITDKHLLHTLPGRILDLNVGVETKTTLDVVTHLVVRIAGNVRSRFSSSIATISSPVS
jgi:hypothetical protein